MNDAAAELDWTPPGPGSWALAADHYPRPITEAHKAFLPIWSETTTAYIRAVGLPVEGLVMAEVNGFPYVSLVGDSPGKPPPPWAMAILARVVPSLRRAERDLRRFLDERGWVDGVAEWYDVLRPAAVARLRAIAAVDVEALDDDELADHVETVLEEWRADARLHLSLGIHDIVPASVFAARLAEHGVDPVTTFGLLAGSSPASRGESDELTALRHALDGRPLVSLDAPGLGAEVDDALAEFLLVHGWRLVDGYDVDCTCLVEAPELALATVAAPPVGVAADLDARTAAVREGLPAPVREQFDADLEDARRSYGLRDDNGLILIAWSTGLLRRAMLRAGRALAGAGALSDPTLAIEATPAELASALRREAPVDADELTRRRAHRARWRAVDAPEVLGDPPAPDPEGMPGALGLMMRALTLMDEGATPPDEPLHGFGVGTDRYEGPVRLVLGAGQGLDAFAPGDVLVAPMTSPSYNRLLGLAGALVTDAGGLLSHAAVMARELGIPAVLATGDATTRLRDGDHVVVDPVAGAVRVVDRPGPATSATAPTLTTEASR